jgi:1-acyl-sn-glycerol-3-phosphate acyltransferase
LIGSGLFALVFLPQLLGPDFRGRAPAFDPSKRKGFDGLALAALLLLGWGLWHLLLNPTQPPLGAPAANLPVAGTLDAEQSNSLFLVMPGSQAAEARKGQEALSARLYPMEKSQKILGWTALPVRIEPDSLRQRRLQAWKDFWSPGQKSAILGQLGPESPDRSRVEWSEASRLMNTDFTVNSLEGSFPQLPAGDLSLLTQVWLRPGSGFSLLQHLKQGLPKGGSLPESGSGPAPGQSPDWSRMAWLAGLCSLIILLLAWGRIELALLAWVPLWAAYGWLRLVIGWSSVNPGPFGPLVPAILYGAGAAYSLWILHDFLLRYRTGAPEARPTGTLLAYLLLVFAFSFSLLNPDEGRQPLGMVLTVSISSTVLLVRLILPRLYSWLIPSRIRKKLYPWTASGLLISIFAFTYFCLGSFLLGLLGFLLVRLNPLNREKGKLLFHTLISKFTWSQLYIMTNLKKRIINPQKEDFSRPVIMICNHQSFLDILATTLLSPKLILLTNDWVWNSPVFGAVVRIADYYPVMAEGIEKSVARLADRVNQGYSVVVFPEGTRSTDGEIRRFHKGAFYLAEKLELDILPVMIHGTSHSMTKGDFLLKDGYVTTKYLPRISARDPRFGEGYAARAKQIGKYFRQEFRQLRREMEQPAWYREKLIYNYIYKGPVLEWYMRIKLQIENNYQQVHDLLPLAGEFLDIGCGYGMMTYLLHFAGPQRRITGIDYDEEKIALAKGCFSRDEGIRFFHSEALQFPMDQYDGILLMDILHYLDRGEQEALLRSCFKSLRRGGKILIREGDADLAGKHRGTRLTEFFSTRLFRFNRTGAGRLWYVSGTRLREIAVAAGLGFRVAAESRYSSNRLFVLE